MLKQKDYSHLIDKNKYQVFLMKSKVNIPFIFAIHPWFVLNNKGKTSRWEVGFSKKDRAEKKWGHLYKNRAPLFQGLEIFPYLRRIFFWKSDVIGIIEGNMAAEMIFFVESSPNNYKYLNLYHLWGPNSNTYAKWVIDNFPGSGFSLPDNAVGKNFK